VDIHVTTIEHTEFRKCEKAGPSGDYGLTAHMIYQKEKYMRIFYQEGIHYRTAPKYRTERVIIVRFTCDCSSALMPCD